MNIITFAKTSITRGIAAGGTFIFSYLLVFVLSPSDYGDFFLAYTLLVGISFLVRIGMETAVLRYASVLVSKQDVIGLEKLRETAVKMTFAISVVVALLTYLLLDYAISAFFQTPLAREMSIVFIIAIPFYAYTEIQSAFVKALKMPDLAAFLERGYIALLSGLLIFAYFKIEDTVSIVNASVLFLVATVSIFITGFLIVKKKYQQLNTAVEILQPLVPDSPSFSINEFFGSLPDYAFIAIVNYLLKFSPVLFLGYFSSSETVGVFSIASNIAFIVSAVMLIINPIFAPYFASLHAKNEHIALKKLLIKCIGYAAIISLPLFLGIFIFTEEILGLFGSTYVDGSIVTLILAVTHLSLALIEPLFLLLNMVGYQREVRHVIAIACVVAIVSLILLVPTYGSVGAAWSIAISMFVQNVLLIYYAIAYFKKQDEIHNSLI